MTIELVLLAASVVLGIVHIIIVSHLQSWQRGYRWTASSREQSVAPLTGLAGRVERALRNYLETFPFFAAAIFVVTVTNRHSWLTVWGAHLYFWGRIVYATLYMADLPFARVEYPNDRHSDECCRAVTEVTIRSHARLRWPVCTKSSRPWRGASKAKVTSRKLVKCQDCAGHDSKARA